MRILFCVLLTIAASSAYASPSATKNEDGSFKLSEKSIQQLGVSFLKLLKMSPWVIPVESLVKIKFTSGVYRRYEGDITFVSVKILKNNGVHAFVESSDLEAGDEVAVTGTSFLRLTEADLNSGTVDSCAH